MSKISHCRVCGIPLDGDHDVCTACRWRYTEKQEAERQSAAQRARDAVEKVGEDLANKAADVRKRDHAEAAEPIADAMERKREANARQARPGKQQPPALHHNEWQILTVLAAQPNVAMIQVEIGDRTDPKVSPQTVARWLKRLRKRGLTEPLNSGGECITAKELSVVQDYNNDRQLIGK